MFKSGIVFVLLAVLLSGCIAPQSDTISDHTVTEADKQWVSNTTIEADRLSSYTSSIETAYHDQDYKALQNFSEAIIDLSDQAIQKSLNCTLSPGMQPAQRAWESSMKDLNMAGWNLSTYANSNGESEKHYSLFKEYEYRSSNCLITYLKYR
ncbi:MAG: hypothetical protein WC180_03080 [Candidatus Paceibacterota bacterium]